MELTYHNPNLGLEYWVEQMNLKLKLIGGKGDIIGQHG